jgi:hypothetical protein
MYRDGLSYCQSRLLVPIFSTGALDAVGAREVLEDNGWVWYKGNVGICYCPDHAHCLIKLTVGKPQYVPELS